VNTQIQTTMTEIQHFFLGDCFLLAHPVHYAVMLLLEFLQFVTVHALTGRASQLSDELLSLMMPLPPHHLFIKILNV